MRRSFGPGEVRARVFALAGVLWTMSARCGDDSNDDAKPRDASVEDAGARDTSTSNTVSYKRDVKPIFAAYCTTRHYSGSVIDVDLMNPFDPEHGVVHLCRPAGRGARAGAPFLDAFLRAAVLRTDLRPRSRGGPLSHSSCEKRYM